MPPVEPAEERFRVLITGFGPFGSISSNPSWLAVKDLNGQVLKESKLRSLSPVTGGVRPHRGRDIHITTVEIQVAYSDVLSIIPGFHLRPPRLPANAHDADASEDEADLAPPENGYDLILHVGVGHSGSLTVETRARKTSYDMPDVRGELAPFVRSSDPSQKVLSAISDAQRYEMQRLNFQTGEGEESALPPRGFNDGYEDFAHELRPIVDCHKLLGIVNNSGFKGIVPSADAGLYLCEFIYYCGLAESFRSVEDSTSPSKVLFVHVPPEGQPFSVEKMTEGIVKVVKTVCWDM